LADEAAFDSVWLNEDAEDWDAFECLGALPQATTRHRVGTGVTNPFLRHPKHVAASVATIDRLCNGRAFFGLGRGEPEWYANALGIEVHSPIAFLAEAINLLDQWWVPPHPASAGGHLPVKQWERSIVSLERPPIYLGAIGPLAVVKERLPMLAERGAPHVFLDRNGLPLDVCAGQTLLLDISEPR
jgi:5,10-methylenetetrahydromethanopterin reductase